jgi:hypothetical protein
MLHGRPRPRHARGVIDDCRKPLQKQASPSGGCRGLRGARIAVATRAWGVRRGSTRSSRHRLPHHCLTRETRARSNHYRLVACSCAGCGVIPATHRTLQIIPQTQSWILASLVSRCRLCKISPRSPHPPHDPHSNIRTTCKHRAHGCALPVAGPKPSGTVSQRTSAAPSTVPVATASSTMAKR